MQITPYLFLDGRCEEAIEFYKKTLSAKVVMLMRFKEAPDQSMISPGAADKIMHASLTIGGSDLMLSDGRNSGHPEFKSSALSLNPKDEAEADRLFAALGEGGQVQMPIGKTFFSRRFGMVADKFGVSWMINVAT